MHLILFNQSLCVVHEEMNKNVRKGFWIHPLFFSGSTQVNAVYRGPRPVLHQIVTEVCSLAFLVLPPRLNEPSEHEAASSPSTDGFKKTRHRKCFTCIRKPL